MVIVQAPRTDRPAPAGGHATARRSRHPQPWPEQQQAVRAITAAIGGGGSTKLILPCGMGKSRVAVLVAERLRAVHVVVAVPSLALLAQTLRLWQDATDRLVLAVCSDETVADDDVSPDDVERLRQRCVVTSDADDVAGHLSHGRPTVVLTTYHSLAITGQGFKRVGSTADLLVADEAHHCAAAAGTTFASALDPGTLAADRRLFMTATPRVTSESVRRGAIEDRVQIFSMDDDEHFGSTAFQVSFATGIRLRRLSDYRLVTLIATARQHELLAALEREVHFNGSSVDSRMLATASQLIDAIDRFDLKRVVTFHNRVVDAEAFAAILPQVARAIRRSIPITRSVSARQDEGQRDEALRQLRDGGRGRAVVVCNVQCLSEGVDVPALDAVVFASPRRSVAGVLQPIGRALRSAPGKTFGYVIVPVVVNGPLDEDTSVIKQPEFDIVWSVARALRDHDERFATELDLRATDRVRAGTELSRVSVYGGTLPSGFLESFHAAVVEHSTSSWLQTFAAVRAFAVAHHRPPRQTESGAADRHLGAWCANQQHRRAALPADRITMLESLPGWRWRRSRAASWTVRYSELKQHLETSASYPPARTRLGRWVRHQRTSEWDGTLSDERRKQLELLPGWSWRTEDREAPWNARYAELQRHLAATGTYPRAQTTLGSWIAWQRTTERNGSISDERRTRLEQLPGWRWSRTAHASASEKAAYVYAVRRYCAEHGTPPPIAHVDGHSGLDIGAWSRGRRKAFANGSLASEDVKELDSIPGWTWRLNRRTWDERIAQLRAYHGAHRRLPRRSDTDSDAVELYDWMHAQRRRSARLSAAQRDSLEQLGLPFEAASRHADLTLIVTPLPASQAPHDGASLAAERCPRCARRLRAHAGDLGAESRISRDDPEPVMICGTCGGIEAQLEALGHPLPQPSIWPLTG